MTKSYLIKSKLWPHLGYEPHDGQQPIHASLARNRVVSAGRRFGKSKLGGYELIPEALLTYSLKNQLADEGKRREFWIVGPEYTDSEKEFRVLWDAAKKLQMPIDRPGSYNNPLSGDMHLSLWQGRFQVHAKSAKYPETLVGEGLSGVILAEAAKLKEKVWTRFIRPALADYRGWSLMTSTPEGKNWFYKRWQVGQDAEKPSWQSWRMPSWVNNFVYPLGEEDPEIKALRDDMSAEAFSQEIVADFTDFVGKVFKDWDEEVHVRNLAYDPKLPLYLASDSGWTNDFVMLWIQVDVWDNVYVIREYRRSKMDISDIASELVRFDGISSARKLYPDPAAPGDANIMSKRLKVPAAKNTGGELKYRLEMIRQHLKLKPEDHPVEKRQPKLFVDRSCDGLIYEMGEYRYPDRKSEAGPAPEEPMKKDDHAPEALGRFFRGYFGPLEDADGGGRAVVTSARVS